MLSCSYAKLSLDLMTQTGTRTSLGEKLMKPDNVSGQVLAHTLTTSLMSITLLDMKRVATSLDQD